MVNAIAAIARDRAKENQDAQALLNNTEARIAGGRISFASAWTAVGALDPPQDVDHLHVLPTSKSSFNIVCKRAPDRCNGFTM